MQRLHILVRQLKIIDISVLLNPSGRDGFGKNDKALLQTPSKQDLRGGLVVLLCQRYEKGVIELGRSDKRTICL